MSACDPEDREEVFSNGEWTTRRYCAMPFKEKAEIIDIQSLIGERTGSENCSSATCYQPSISQTTFVKTIWCDDLIEEARAFCDDDEGFPSKKYYDPMDEYMISWSDFL